MEDKIKFYEIDLDLEYDGDETDLRLHGREKLNWGAETPAEYEEATNAIDAISYKGNGWEVYATYDVSGFHYWMLQQEEPNYINMTIMFDNDTVDVTEIPAIKNAMDMAYSDAYSIAEKYDYVPNSEYKRGGRIKSALMRDRAYKSNEPHEQAYERKSRPKNPRYAKYAEGGGVDDYKITLKSWIADVYEDDYNEGEGKQVNSFGETVNKSFSTAEDFFKYINNNVLYTDMNKEYYDIMDDGRIVTSLLVDVDNSPASKSEIEEWKNGNLKLYSARYDFYVTLTKEKEPTADELSELLGIGVYKQGGSVKAHYNTGRSWHLDRQKHNKSEDWEKPLNQRGKSVRKSVSRKSVSSKGKSKNYMYIPNYMISGAEVSNKGKTTDIDGANILDGIYVKKGTKYAEGGGVGNGYMVFNYTDNLYASNDIFATKKEANNFISQFRKRFEQQGYYRDSNMNKIDIDDIDLLVIDESFNPFRYAEGGGVGKNFEDWLKENDIDVYKRTYYWVADDGKGDYRQVGTKAQVMKALKDEWKSSKYAEGGGVPDLDKKMALINLDMIHEYSVKLDNMVTEETELEEWVKMKLTRIEQNVADVKHAVSGGEKFDGGGMIFKKQLLHISKYAKELIDMVQAGSNLMAWQENKLAIAADNIDGIYHYMDYLENKNKKISDEYLPFAEGGGISDKTSWTVGQERKGMCKYYFLYNENTGERKGHFDTMEEAKETMDSAKRYGLIYAKGGGVGEIKVGDFVKKEGSNYAYKVLEISHNKNDGKDYITIYDDVLDYTQTVNNISDYELVKYAKGGRVPRNVGRDYLFKSKQDWEQDYDRKREYKEYKKEGWLANWFKDGGGVGDFKGVYSSDEMFTLNVYNLKNELLSSKNFRAKNQKEANQIAEYDYEEQMQKKFGKDLRFEVKLAPNNYAKGGRVKNYKYVPNHMIESVDVERNGKTTEIDGGNILDGLYVKNTKFEHGGETTGDLLDLWQEMGGEKKFQEEKNYDYGSDLTDEAMVKNNLVNGEISADTLKRIVGCELSYPYQIVGAIKLEKCFMRPYYRIA